MAGPQLWTSWAAYPHVVSDLELINDAIDDLYDLTAASVAIVNNLDSVYLGAKSDSFILRSSSDGDQTAALSAFLADTSLSGRRKIVGYAKISDEVAVPAGIVVDATNAVIEQTGSNKTAFSLGAGARWIGGEIHGKTTDFVAGTGSFTPTAVGVKLAGDGAVVEGLTTIGIANAAVYAINAANTRVYGLTVVGVHGLSGVTIPAGDARCYAVAVYGGCPTAEWDDITVDGVSIGLIASPDTTDLVARGIRLKNVIGQHGLYLQCGTGLSVTNVQGRDVALNLVKVQLSAVTGHTDALGTNIQGLVGRTVGDCVLLMNNTETDLSTADKHRGVTVSDVVGYNANRVGYFGSIRGGSFSNIVGYNTTQDTLTILDSQDAVFENIVSAGSGRMGVRITSIAASNCATQRVSLRGVRVRNPGGTNEASNKYGLYVAGLADGVDCKDITVDGFNASADNGLMDYGMFFAAGHQESFRFRNARVDGWALNPYRLATGPRAVAEWHNVGDNERTDGAPTIVLNWPTTVPIRVGSVGAKTIWSCDSLPVSGVYYTGDRIEITNPAAGGIPGYLITNVGGLYAGSWIASTAYTLGTWRRTAAGRAMECTVAGTSSTVEPTFTTVGQTFVDGPVTWICRSLTLAVAKAQSAIAA